MSCCEEELVSYLGLLGGALELVTSEEVILGLRRKVEEGKLPPSPATQNAKFAGTSISDNIRSFDFHTPTSYPM
jgi:hypothetical protein